MGRKTDVPLEVRRREFQSYRAKIRIRPTNPKLVGRSGTVVSNTLDEQLRFEVDLLPDEKWARTVLVLEEDLQRLA